jgi:SAM-dependent methyltransferase
VELKDLKGKTVLEVGCGAGRFTEIMISSGATVWSLDLSNAVDANALNCPVTPSHVILQADASDIPLRHNFFDFVICVGVLQHTEYPGRVVDELIRVTKPGGFICIDHYRLTFSFVTRLLPIYRFLLKLLPIKDTLKTAKVLVALLLPIHKFLGGTVFGYALLSRVSPIVSYYHRFPELSEGSQNEWATLDTHDSLFDRFKKLHTTRSLRQFLERRGADIIKLEKAGIGFEVILRKAEYR